MSMKRTPQLSSRPHSLTPVVPDRFAPVLAELAEVSELFRAADKRLYLVGGTVRDLLGGHTSTAIDFDATTNARPDEIKRLLSGWADAMWNQGQEISLFDLSEDASSQLMSDTIINSIVYEMQPKLIYVYDFFNLWTFYVELAEIVEEIDGASYPNLLFSKGQIPEVAPEKLFESEDLDDFNEFDDDLDIDDYENLDFDENWN